MFVCAFLLWRAIAWIHTRDIARLNRSDGWDALYGLEMNWGWRNVTYAVSVFLEVVLSVTASVTVALAVLHVIEINWSNVPILSIVSLVIWLVNLGLFVWALSQGGHQSLNDDGYRQDTSYAKRNETIRLFACIFCALMCCISVGGAILSTAWLVIAKLC